MKREKKYVAFLRGINVGGNHKVPMEQLRKELEKLKCKKVVTLLNSGNIIFETTKDAPENLENYIENHLKNTFGFPIPVIIRSAKEILALVNTDPFKHIKIIQETRLYVSFLKKSHSINLPLPWFSDDRSYTILDIQNTHIISVLDLSVSKTPKAMAALEKYFGNNITTRSWNTIHRIAEKLNIET